MINPTANLRALPAVLFSQAILCFIAIKSNKYGTRLFRAFLAVKTALPEVCADWLFKITWNTQLLVHSLFGCLGYENTSLSMPLVG